MRSRTRRSFAFEVKAAGRRQATVIPSRITPPVTPATRVFEVRSAEQPAAVVKPRRILPNLIVPEAPQTEPDTVSVAAASPQAGAVGR